MVEEDNKRDHEEDECEEEEECNSGGGAHDIEDNRSGNGNGRHDDNDYMEGVLSNVVAMVIREENEGSCAYSPPSLPTDSALSA